MLLASQIDTIIAGAIERRVFPGAVVWIGTTSQVLHHAAYGSTMYDAPESQPVRPTTIYDIASLTKVFTATAALQLLDAGALVLHAPARAYLPELRASGVTIFHLLTHTSGLDLRLSALRQRGHDGLLAAVYDAEPLVPPGSRVAYTNVNSLLLGEVVARLHGAPLDAALGDLLVGPLGLRDTGFLPAAELRPRIAPTEIDAEWRGGLVHGTVHDESAHALGGVAGHAGLFSTALDLAAFCRMWLRAARGDEPPPAPSRATAALATTNHTPDLALGCGLGWMIDRTNFMGGAPSGTFGHTGFTGPALALVPSRDLAVVVLSNRVYPRRQPPLHHDVTAAIVNAALGAV